MDQPSIALKLKAKQFLAIYNLALTVYDNMHANPLYASPMPSMPVFLTYIQTMRDRMADWGATRNRGSHYTYIKLQEASVNLHQNLKALAAYCTATVIRDVPPVNHASALASSGFPLKKQKQRQGRLKKVENLRVAYSKLYDKFGTKLRWDKPLDVTTRTNVKSYRVYRNNVADFATAQLIDVITKTSYIDKPGFGEWTYWVVAVNHLGNGATSDAVTIMTL